MSKRMTVIFEDEGLYTALKVEAARKGQPAKDIVALSGGLGTCGPTGAASVAGPGAVQACRTHTGARPEFSTAGSVDRHPQGRSALGIHVLVVVASLRCPECLRSGDRRRAAGDPVRT